MGEKGNMIGADVDPMGMLTDMSVSALRESPEIWKKWSDAYLAYREIQAQNAELSAQKAALSAQQAQMAADKAVEAAVTEATTTDPEGQAKAIES